MIYRYTKTTKITDASGKVTETTEVAEGDEAAAKFKEFKDDFKKSTKDLFKSFGNFFSDLFK